MYVKLQKIVLPMSDFHAAAGVVHKNLAVVQMEFDEEDVFLFMMSMALDIELVRDYTKDDIIVMWDLVQNMLITDHDQLRRPKWPTFTLSNPVYARYQGNAILPESEEEEKKLRVQENCQMSALQRFFRSDNAVCGNVSGDLFLFRFPALFVDKSRVLGKKTPKLGYTL